MPNKIDLPFQPEWESAMLSGKKTATTRTRRYGYPGNQFEAFGGVFILTEVYPSFLDVIVTAHYIEEGFNSPLEFIEFWDKMHPHIIYLQRPGRAVYFHRFALCVSGINCSVTISKNLARRLIEKTERR
jgi:hypothetical protein